MKVNEVVRQRIMRIADRLLDRQLSVAVGQSFLYRMDKYWIATSKNSGRWGAKPPVIVDDPDEIRRYLEGEFDGASDTDGSASYYFITTKEPNTRAIENMLDRALGGAPRAIELSNPDGSLKNVTIIKYVTNSGDKSTTKTD